MSDRPLITPHMKVGELLDAYPQLEDLLIEIAPEFARLRNPLLRKTVAKVTTLEQAARVGGLGLGELINRLRAAAGQEGFTASDPFAGQGERPAWVDQVKVVTTDDAREAIAAGEHPLPRVLAAVGALEPGQAHLLITPFVPAPLLDKVRDRGLQVWTDARGADTFYNLLARVEG